MTKRTAPEAQKTGGRPRDSKADEAILKAGLALFIAEGIEGASIERIAKKAGVAKTTIYRRWSSKEKLLAEALKHLRQSAESAYGDWAMRPVAELLDMAVALAPRLLAGIDARNLTARLIGSMPSAPELIETYWTTVVEPRRRAFGAILEKAREHNELPPDADPEIVQDIIAGALLYDIMLRPGERSPKAMEAYMARVLRQIGIRK